MSVTSPRSPAGVAPASRRKVRLWMVSFLLTPVILLAVVFLAFETSGPNEPTIHPRFQPAGYQAITDAYFGYSIPKAWSQQAAWTSQDGDFFYGSPSAFVAETLVVTKHAPTARSRPPSAFGSFGLSAPTKVSLRGPATRLRVPGTAGGWRVEVTRPGGFVATALDVWQPSTTTQLWLLIRAPASVTATVIRSLNGG